MQLLVMLACIPCNNTPKLQGFKMADIYAIFGTLLALGIAFPGILTAWWLLFPKKVEVARQRIADTPWRTFTFGLFSTICIAIPLLIMASIPFPFTQLLAAAGAIAMLGFATIGAAGIAAQMATRLRQRSNLSEPAAFVRAAVAFELAAAFPLIGWFFVIPISIIISIGASVYAILGWKPRAAATPAPETPTISIQL